jgi:hypothetical protein
MAKWMFLSSSQMRTFGKFCFTIIVAISLRLLHPSDERYEGYSYCNFRDA